MLNILTALYIEHTIIFVIMLVMLQQLLLLSFSFDACMYDEAGTSCVRFNKKGNAGHIYDEECDAGHPQLKKDVLAFKFEAVRPRKPVDFCEKPRH